MNGNTQARAVDSPTAAETKDSRVTTRGDDSALPAPVRKRRSATPPPVPAAVEDVIPINAANNGKMQQMLHLQDFLHGSVEMGMGTTTLDSSSPPEEIQSHIADLRHRIGMLNALSKVLVEELDMLEASLLNSKARAESHT